MKTESHLSNEQKVKSQLSNTEIKRNNAHWIFNGIEIKRATYESPLKFHEISASNRIIAAQSDTPKYVNTLNAAAPIWYCEL